MSTNEEKLQNQRHTLAHLLAATMLDLYPGSQNAIGPAVDNGFYQDFEVPISISENDLPKIEAAMKEKLKSWQSFTTEEVTPEKAKTQFAWNKYKLELIEDLEADGKTITFQTIGEFIDLCKGGHIDNASTIDPESFKLDRVAGSYWKNNENNKMLTRIYGLAFETKAELDAYIQMREEAEKRDHKKLGIQMDLFCFSDLVGSGLPLWTPKGTLLYNLLDDYVWELRARHGYQKVEIPHITKKDLYETSGHWDKFKDELFRITTREGHEFAMKPMNCPHHTQIYNRKRWSYRELPQRYANTTMCYRDEQSGELSGLSRVRSFTQDDAHIFCRMTDAKAEFLKVWDIVYEFYNTFEFELKVRLSMWDPGQPEKYLGKSEQWEMAQNTLREIAKEKGNDFYEAVGEAAFYGPKLDFIAKDSIGREWQVATIQFDFNMPERFDLFCVNEEGQQERIVMVHAAIMGSIERFLSVYIEHTAGNFPLWLSPVQAMILPISEKHAEYAKKVMDDLATAIPEIRIEVDQRNESVGKRIREAVTAKIPYLLVVGDKEIEANTVSVRSRSDEDLGAMSFPDLCSRLSQEVINKK